ncbi:dethiobiotin synthase [Neobacillus massiliamazoniensis]|uniref:ATP-dependent dethiobiotin synthetase BioD n=1 Tax=Neobacillus massiliamazoniensis TaxID=1499688 RepID=A0A0U1NT48_9BACI|nr:dethiobiotin synthase [Neobacillus massiliamazoniensis]CRK81207.1 dethiobiotin synthase [Neobacillus massiliamazoniensis]
MGKSFFITGTGTDIGKTISTGFLYFSLNKLGLSTTVFKPFQTGLIEQTQTYPDLDWFSSVIGVENAGFYTFEPETSPHLAAKLQGAEVNIEAVLQRLKELEQAHDVVLVEGAGGLAVPLIEREDDFYMTKDFIKDANIPAILVSPSGLGSIHDVLTTNEYAQHYGISIQSLIFNRYEEKNAIHQNNIETIQRIVQLPAFTIPFFKDVKNEIERFSESCIQSESFEKQIKEVFLHGTL